jgi:archaemetzincin
VASEIHLLNGSALPERDLRSLDAALVEIFAAAVVHERAALDLSRAYDASRRQSNSTALLAQILNDSVEHAHKRIAIVDIDLFVPILTFVFGEAQLGGTAAIVSTHRLANQFYGLTRDPGLLLKRLGKEIIHELGHTYGLLHCHQFECVMRSSTYVEEIDMKRTYPCADCGVLLPKTVQNHPPV